MPKEQAKIETTAMSADETRENLPPVIAKQVLEGSQGFEERVLAIQFALRKGMPLHEAEERLDLYDWLDEQNYTPREYLLRR